MKKYFLIGVLACFSVWACTDTNSEWPANLPKTYTVVNAKTYQTAHVKTPDAAGTLIFISGFDSELSGWEKVYDQLPQNWDVFTYNRPGVGGTPSNTDARDAASIALEMHAMYQAVSLTPPYILVGHSMGGIYARMYYHTHPEHVKGIVLVDATHEAQQDSLLLQLPESYRDSYLEYYMQLMDSLALTFPEGSIRNEFRANYRDNFAQIKNYPPITDCYMYVITSLKATDQEPAATKALIGRLHQQWVTAAGAKGYFKSTTASEHFIQLTEPELISAGIEFCKAP